MATRQQAETWIGGAVEVWTAANGEYVGILESISGKPWRGTVRITGIVRPAQVFEWKRSHRRRGFRPGQLITAGGVNIKRTTQSGVSYLEALRQEYRLIESLKARHVTTEEAWIRPTLQALNAAIAAELEN